jgi:Glyoxalase-like domain
MHAPVHLPPVAALLLLSPLVSRQARAQVPVLELDHIYVVVQPPASRGAEALRRAGMVVDTTVERHEGLGTASIAAFFDNAYLELLWVDSGTSVDSIHLADLADLRRAADWRTSGGSPFGLGLHVVTGSLADLPIPGRRDPAPHLGPDAFYLLLRQPEEQTAADVFVMPPKAAATSWLGRYRARRPDLFAHPLAAHHITRVLLCGLPVNRPRAMDLGLPSIGFEPASTQYAIVEFDGGLQGREWDLRPDLPLVLRR